MKPRSVFLTQDGVTRSLADWARTLGLPRITIYDRYRKGYPTDLILAAEKFHEGGGTHGLDNLKNKVFGYLLVLRQGETAPRRRIMWWCRCICN